MSSSNDAEANGRALQAKESGNAAFKKGRFVEAVGKLLELEVDGHYTTAFLLNPTDSAALLNRAQAYLKLEKWQDCERDCTTVIHSAGQERNVKAFFRRALARKEMGELNAAKADLASVLSIEPGNTAARDEITEMARMKPTASSSRKPFSWPPPAATPHDAARNDKMQEDEDLQDSRTKEELKSEDGFMLMKEVSTTRHRQPITPGTTAQADSQPSATTSSTSQGSFVDRKAAREGTKRSFTKPSPVGSNQPEMTKSSLTSQPDTMDVDEESGGAGADETARKDVPAPTSGTELFMRIEDARSWPAKWDVIRSLSPSRFQTLLSGILEPDHLALLYGVFSQVAQIPEHGGLEQIKGYLDALEALPRYGMTDMLLSDDERAPGLLLRQILGKSAV